jgi:hypothetical protein
MNKNYFKFSVSYKNNLLSERIFDADCYNPMVRQMVNIKDLVPEIRKVLQKILSIPTQRLSNDYYVGFNKQNKPITIKIDDLADKKLNHRFQYLKEKHKTSTSSIKDRNINKQTIDNNLSKINDKYMIVVSLKDNSTELFYKKNIQVTNDSIIDVQAKSNIAFTKIKQIEFVEELQFDFSLYLNENYIIQRKFTVFNFNPDSILSEEFIKINSDICNIIKNHIKKADIDAQYMDYEIMCKHDMVYNDLKALSQEDKKKLLKLEYSYN